MEFPRIYRPEQAQAPKLKKHPNALKPERLQEILNAKDIDGRYLFYPLYAHVLQADGTVKCLDFDESMLFDPNTSSVTVVNQKAKVFGFSLVADQTNCATSEHDSSVVIYDQDGASFELAVNHDAPTDLAGTVVRIHESGNPESILAFSPRLFARAEQVMRLHRDQAQDVA